MPRSKKPSRGFFTMAQNGNSADYVRLAYGLALSLKYSQPTVSNLSIGVTPGTVVEDKYSWIFDHIIEIPWGDAAETSDWKLENEWKSLWMTPYDETIKLDADMLFFSSIDSWWKSFHDLDMDYAFTNTVLDWRGTAVTKDFYRKVFTINDLPNVYTGCFYFRKTDRTYDLFNLVKIIYWNWESFFGECLKPEDRPKFPSTDVIFALALKLLDFDQETYSMRTYPTFTHMKSRVQNWEIQDVDEDWRKHLKVFFSPGASCKIGNHRQVYPLHYHVKEFLSDEMISIYERLVKNA